ncbi:MAG TPA: Rieske (2Fe-2S) protein [Deltaproteobacteria bacterium]|nr:Rieske (2Fe-2S) protein [Candidatus Binatota bacterium]HIL13474.1 Rieske (2Fe-2S) protein [Deltaproteobacteria bacterium]
MAPRTMRIDAASKLAEGETLAFSFTDAAPPTEGGVEDKNILAPAFLLRHEGRLLAYRNRCRHIPTTLDWVENRFLSNDRCWIVCATHGALYEPATGLCVAGPPSGKSLESLPVVEEDGVAIVELPPLP